MSAAPPPPPPPPPSPRGNDSSSSSSSSAGSGGGGGGGCGYPPPPPPPPPPPTPPTTNTSNNVVVGPNKLAPNNDHNYIHHHQHHSHAPPFDQIATGGAGYHQQQQQQQQQPLGKVHNRNDPPPPQQQQQPVDRWSTLLPMYHHHYHHHHHRPPLDSHSLPLETTRPEFNTRPADKDTFTGSTNTRYDHRGRDRDVHCPEFKEGYAAPPGMNWKDSKDHYRVASTTTTTLTKRAHADTTSGAVPNNSDTWDALRSNLHAPVQEAATVHERDYVDSQEAVAENRVDPKGEDRNKDKDRKRKDLKHRDWGGERDKDRGERRGNLQLGSGSTEGVKEPSAKEDDRWDREKKDPSKDREKSKEMEKDPIKRETWNGGGPEKDGLNNEKEPSMDISGRTPERETLISEQKKPKDHDGWRTADREVRDRRKERDGDFEPERPEKRSRCYDKESDDGCADPDGGTEKDREGFSYGVQQRKRMLRSRGSPQVGNREPRFRSRAQDNEGAQGKPEVSTVVYRVGECMQELIKLWKDYESSQADKNGECSQASPTLEIRIPAEFITATNRQVRGGQLWGTDVYTDDSDLVAVLMHTGYCRPTASPPPPAILELRATVRVLPPQDCYTSTLRNNVRSRAWGAAIGCSYRVEHCCIFKKGGGTIDLEPCLTHTSTLEPTLAPVAVERTMTTRAAASNALRQQRFVREVTIQYNLCNEPWIKYSLSVVADKGLKKPLYTSARLKKGEVLYLETHSRRYELCFSGEKMVKAAISSLARDMDVEKTRCHNLHSMDGEKEKGGLSDGDTVLIDVFRWSRCKRPLPQNLLRSSGIPLPSEHLEVLEENLDWEDIQWSQTGVFIAGKEYALARLHFISPN